MGYYYLFSEQFGIICFMNKIKENIEETSLILKSNKNKIISYIKDIVIVSVSAQIMIMPIIAYNYKTISFTFFITNIFTSFLIGIIIIFGFVLIIISFLSLKVAKLLGYIYKPLIKLLSFITENTAKIPFSKVYIKSPYILEIIVYYILVFILIYLYKRFGKEKIKEKLKRNFKNIIAIFLIIIIIFNLLGILKTNNLRIYFIDVGQGDSSLIITPRNKTILIDRRWLRKL